MASPIDPADLKSTHMPALLAEVAQSLQLAEQGATPAKNNVSVAMNAEGTTLTITANLPIAAVVSSTTGKIELAVTDYV